MKSLEINGISKYFGKNKEIIALEDINLEVENGRLFGLIGPDGAGKTTLFRILTTLILADKGSSYVMGHDVVKDFKKIRGIVGYMPGRFSLYQDLSVEENLNFFATLFGTTIEKNYHLIKDIYVQLEPFKTRKAGALSGGMKQKLALCCALVHRPEILFLDEPTTGVDVVSRREFWEMLKRLNEEGITVFVSTPYMDEASLCDEIALIQKGKILSTNTPDQMIMDYPDKIFGLRGHDMYRLLLTLESAPMIKSVNTFGDFHHVTLEDQKSIEQLENHLSGQGMMQVEIRPLIPDIEDVFLSLMDKESIG